MKKVMFATVAATALAALTLGAPAVATAVPSGTGSAQDTVDQLEGKGYHVMVEKLGPAPLALCTVDWLHPADISDRSPVNRVVLQPVYMTARC